VSTAGCPIPAGLGPGFAALKTSTTLSGSCGCRTCAKRSRPPPVHAKCLNTKVCKLMDQMSSNGRTVSRVL
jgi:hypothetical protein